MHVSRAPIRCGARWLGWMRNDGDMLLAMMDSSTSMLGHVELRLRLVYESFGSAPIHSDIPGWKLVGLLPDDVTEPPDGTGSSPDEPRTRTVVTEPVTLTLDRDEAEGYYLNLTSPQPSLFALIRLPDVAAATAAQAPLEVPQSVAITASYNEAARWMDGGMVVVRTALPGPMLAWIAEFAQHHFQVEGRKKGGKFRPSFLSREEFGQVAKAAHGQAGEVSGAGEGKRLVGAAGAAGSSDPAAPRRH